ncbi:MAG: hypothetical protein QXL58_04435 [Candidatus Hadarchaeales archaeon]
MELKNVRGQISISITGTVFIALALLTVLSLATGIAFNKLQAGLGDPLIAIGLISFIILILFAFLYAFLYWGI